MKLVKLLAVSLVVVALSACSKVNDTNYRKLEVGMEKADVEAVLGEADSCEGKLAESCIWGTKEGNYIQIEFVSGYVATYSKKIQ